MSMRHTRSFRLFREKVRRYAPRAMTKVEVLDEAPELLEHAMRVMVDWPQGARKPRVGLVRDIDSPPYWTKYRRFLQTNDIPFELYDIHRSSWLREAQRYDIVVWRPLSYPYEMDECRRKFYVLEKEMGIVCYPSYAESLLYEDKVLQYDVLKRHGLPVIETLVTNSEEEALAYIEHCEFPLVWKIGAGSGSLGVELVKDRRTARRWIRQVFSVAGRPTYWPFQRQKDYVYLQEFVPGAKHDLRVGVTRHLAYSYFRDVPEGEFRASGMGRVRFECPPVEPMLLAREVRRVFDSPHLCVDVLPGQREGEWRIIEITMFPNITRPDHLYVDGRPGAFVFDSVVDDEHRFEPLSFWPQEIALQDVVQNQFLTRQQS